MFFFGKNRKNKIKDKLTTNINEPFSLKDVFEDEALSELIAGYLGLKNNKEKTTLNQLSKIEKLEASGKGIRSLSGLEFLNGLKIADFSNNMIERLPDYSEYHPNLYKNKETLIYMDLKDNPFLREEFLFNLDNSENRRLFFNQFKNYSSRFYTGDNVQKKLFSKTDLNPQLIYYFIERSLPSLGLENKKQAVNDLLIQYLVGKELLFDQKPNYDYFFDNNTLIFRDENSKLEANDLNLLDPYIENLIPEDDKYLIKSLIKHYDQNERKKFNSYEEALNFYRKNLNLISTDFIHNAGSYDKKTSYKQLSSSEISDSQEKRLNAVKNQRIKDLYLKYLEFENILNEYAQDHSSQDVIKYVNKSNDFINHFMDQYLELQDNPMLSDLQKARINEAEPALEKFVNNFTEEARSFFEQDIFGLEVEMKYIDMLSEANRKFGL